jgi:hypothetical protein
MGATGRSTAFAPPVIQRRLRRRSFNGVGAAGHSTAFAPPVI